MPSTAQNITKIFNAVKNYSREQIREELNELQLIVYSENMMQNSKIDPATGMPPYLVTTAGQFQYDCPADCRETLGIFWESARNGYTASNIRGESTYYQYKQSSYRMEPVTSRNALADTLATVTFLNDPGDTTERFFHDYTIRPTFISSESIQLDIPEELHYLMRKAVIAVLSTENYGETGFDDAVIKEISKKIRRKLNKGTQARANRTPIQPEFMDGDLPYNYR